MLSNSRCVTYFGDGAQQSPAAGQEAGLLALLRQHLVLQHGRGQAAASSAALKHEGCVSSEVESGGHIK